MPTIPNSATRKPIHNKCYGIEIECYVPRNTVRYHSHVGMFFVGMDGSLQYNQGGQVGVEFVSQPLPYKWLDKEIAKLYKRHPWTRNDSCGIHVHVSKASVSRHRMLELLSCLWGLNDTQAMHLFGRTWNMHNHPACENRYCSINMRNANTIEFRMFASGDAAWARECLRRTKLMVEYKGKCSYGNLCELFGLPAVHSTPSLGDLLRRQINAN